MDVQALAVAAGFTESESRFSVNPNPGKELCRISFRWWWIFYSGFRLFV